MRYKTSIILLFTAILAGIGNALAQDLLIGGLEVEGIGNLNYRATIELYTRTSANVNRDSIVLSWGDGTRDTISGIKNVYANDLTKYTFNHVHTFSGNGTFLINYIDSFRAANIQNIPNSNQALFQIEYELLVDTPGTFNSSPILLDHPIDTARLNQQYFHNLNAFDQAGDSLVFSFIPLGETNGFVPNGMLIDPAIGEITWPNPEVEAGTYIIGIQVEEWRDNVKIGFLQSEIMIEVTAVTSISHPILESEGQGAYIYPNPFSQSATLIMPPGYHSKHLTFTMFDILGNEVKRIEKISSNGIIIERENLKSGVYFYRVEDEKEMIETGKLLIN